MRRVELPAGEEVNLEHSVILTSSPIAGKGVGGDGSQRRKSAE
jgi:hypothetical protein